MEQNTSFCSNCVYINVCVQPKRHHVTGCGVKTEKPKKGEPNDQEVHMNKCFKICPLCFGKVNIITAAELICPRCHIRVY